MVDVRGRPSYVISKEQLSYLIEQGFKLQEIATMLDVSCRTVKRRMMSLWTQCVRYILLLFYDKPRQLHYTCICLHIKRLFHNSSEIPFLSGGLYRTMDNKVVFF